MLVDHDAADLNTAQPSRSVHDAEAAALPIDDFTGVDGDRRKREGMVSEHREARRGKDAAPRMNAREINFDALVGPTHNYAGLAYGNVASIKNKASISSPRQARSDDDHMHPGHPSS